MTRAARTGHRVAAIALVALSVLTLAPRTSEHSDTGWDIVRVAETTGRAKGGVTTLTFWATPPRPVPDVTRLPVYVDATSWQLVAASPGCSKQAGAVVCVITSDQVRRKHVLTITVRSAQPVSFSFVPPGQ